MVWSTIEQRTKKALVLLMVTAGLTVGSFVVLPSTAEARWVRRCHRVWYGNHFVRRCNRVWVSSRSRPSARRQYRSYNRPYNRQYDRQYDRRYR